MKTQIYAVPVALALALTAVGATGCSMQRKSEATSVQSSASASLSPSEQHAGKSPQSARLRAISVSSTLRVGSIEKSSDLLRSEAERLGGYVADAKIGGDDNARYANLDLRVPASELRVFLACMGRAGESVEYTERADDVTDEHADLAARLLSSRTQERRILEIMSTKAATLTETIEAERELGRLREGIERMEGQNTGIERRVAYATVNVTLQGTPAYAWQSPGRSIANSASAGGRGAATFFVYVAMTVVAVAPTLLPILLLSYAAWWLMRAHMQKRRARAQTQLQAAS